MGEDEAAFDLEWNAKQKFAAGARRSGQAFAAVGLVQCAVRLAHQVAAAFGEEMIVHPIHRNRDMAAAIDVGVELAAKIDHETLFVSALNGQDELARLARRDLFGARHQIAPCGRRWARCGVGAGAFARLRGHLFQAPANAKTVLIERSAIIIIISTAGRAVLPARLAAVWQRPYYQ